MITNLMPYGRSKIDLVESVLLLAAPQKLTKDNGGIIESYSELQIVQSLSHQQTPSTQDDCGCTCTDAPGTVVSNAEPAASIGEHGVEHTSAIARY